jgi:putative ABC exporter
MISALFYLQYHSIRNRLVMRLKRLRQPKYLVGGIVGGLYFYFYFFRYLFSMRAKQGPLAAASSPQDLAFYEGLGALILLVIVLAAWVVPHQRAALAFTEAEVAFLFPAPISRRGLIHFKLLRSQTAIFFTTLLLTLVSNRFGGRNWVHALGWWLILSTLNLHFLGSSFARTMLLDRGITNWQRRVSILVLLLAAGGGVLLWARRTIPPPDLAQMEGVDSLKSYFQQVLTSGPAPWLLFPFRVIVRPYLAQSPAAFLGAAIPALGLLLLHYLWVIRSNVAFEEASVEVSRRLAEKVAAMRAGNWQSADKKSRRKRPPFTLRPSGPQAIALLWKNLVSAGQAFTLRIWIVLAATAAGAAIGFGQTLGTSGWAPAIGMVAGMLILWTLLLGPQFLRQDFRQDLPSADILKLYPMHGWQIALGELLAPAVILTAIQWALLIIGAALLTQSRQPLPPPMTLAMALGAAVLLPMLNLITLQIPNAAVLLFPAWFQASREGAHGIEATGQRLIFVIGQFLAFIVALIPAAAFFIGVLFVLRLWLALYFVIPLASLAAALVLGLEGVLGVFLLGWLFERLDLSAELPA